MTHAPLLLPALAFLAGTLAEQHAFALPAIVAASAAFGVAALASPTNASTRVRGVAVAAALGVGVSFLHGHPFVLERERSTARYQATVIGDVRATPDGEATLLAIAGIGAVRATLHARVEPGERLALRGRLEPFDLPRNPGEPSQRALQRAEGIAGRLAAATVLARAPPDPLDLRTWAPRLRAAASRIVRARIPEPSATILAGALWGERGALPSDLRDAFQATGTVHVLVTAGLHLGAVAALCLWLLRAIGTTRVPACLLAIGIVAAYAWWSGAHLPSQRAAVMVAVALAARACGARIASWNALAAAAIAVAALWPAAVESASFALSFSCVAAILLFAEPLALLFARLPAPERVREAVALTIAAQLGTWPLAAALFSTLAPYAVVANAAVVPLTVVAIGGGLATLALPFAAPFETLDLRAIEAVVRIVASWPGSRASMAQPPIAAIALYDAFALAAGLAVRRGHGALCAVLLVLGATAVAILPRALAPHGFAMTFLDVGQGDAAVIRTPHGGTILIDSGGELERAASGPSSAETAGERIVLGYLLRAGIRRVDLLVLTHPHGDHVGGCAPIVRALHVEAIFDGGQPYRGRAYADCLAAARARGTRVVLTRAGIRANVDGVTLDVIAPSMPFLADTGDDVNENSIVLSLRYGTFRALFTGDAGRESEARLLARGVDLHADVLKVGHHGSAYASTPAFIAAVRPRLAIISDGRHNTFGHPAPSTLATLAAAGALVYRTDRCGAVTIDVDAGRTMTMLRCPTEHPWRIDDRIPGGTPQRGVTLSANRKTSSVTSSPNSRSRTNALTSRKIPSTTAFASSTASAATSRRSRRSPYCSPSGLSASDTPSLYSTTVSPGESWHTACS